ncbi:hypothetical protein V8D89_001289 [Ganoderma adspersum]
MSTAPVSAQDISALYTSLRCGYAVFGLLVYDWLLCIGEEARFIWKWHSRATGSSLVYVFSRYAVLASNLLSILTVYPMSDSSSFSALRAYALSDRNVWLAGIIIALALPSPVMTILQGVKSEFQNLPSPWNCSISSSLSTTLSIRVNLVSRASQLAAELLVVVITWWYTYQSYHVWKDGLKLGRSLSSLLIYNGELFFATWYVLDIILNATPVPPEALYVDNILVTTFYDPITSILICRFILSLRQFNSRTASPSYSRTSFRVGEHLVTTLVPEFAAKPGDILPDFIASFSHPVHTDSDLSETDIDSDAGDLSPGTRAD